MSVFIDSDRSRALIGLILLSLREPELWTGLAEESGSIC